MKLIFVLLVVISSARVIEMKIPKKYYSLYNKTLIDYFLIHHIFDPYVGNRSKSLGGMQDK